MLTTIDVTRQTRKFYMQANLLLRNFIHCSDDVKCSLFQTYCCQLWGIPSFAELLRKTIYRFTKRIEVSSNSIIAACLSPLLHISSHVRKWWSSVLHVN